MNIKKRLFTVVCGTAGGQIVTALSTPILTRLYAPEAHAGWALFLSMAAVFAAVATFRYELAIVLPRETKTAAALAIGGSCSVIVVGLLASVFVWFLFGAVHLVNDQRLRILFSLCVFPSVAAVAILQLASAWCVRQESFAAYAIAQFAMPVCVVAVQCMGALLGHRTAGVLVIGNVAGQCLAAVIVVCSILRRDWARFREALEPAYLRQTMVDYRQYPIYMTPYTLVSVCRDRLAYFLLGRFGLPVAVGYYNLVARITAIPNSFVAGAVRPVFFQHAASVNPRTLEVPVAAVIEFLGLTACAFWGVFVANASWIIGLIFGGQWEAAAPFAIALSVPALPLLVGNWADRMFDVMQQQRLAFLMEVIFSCLSMGGLLAGFLIFNNLHASVYIQSAILSVYYILWLYVLFAVAGYRRMILTGILLKMLVCALVSLALSIFVVRFTGHGWGTMIGCLWCVALLMRKGTFAVQKLKTRTDLNTNTLN